MIRILVVIATGLALPPAAQAAEPVDMKPAFAQIDEAAAARFARLALDCVHREYPGKVSHVLHSDDDARPPRELTPAFYGCYDWHSSVHGHWLLARLAREFPEAALAGEARAALGRSLTAANITGELEYVRGPGRASFERPYGLAWLLQLAAELRQWEDTEGATWATTLAPLEKEAALRIATWLPKLHYPIRVGEHSQTAFAFGLIRDWALVAGNEAMRALIDAKAREFYLVDRNCPLGYEPSGEDFLSPCLAEADLMRRVLDAAEFPRWLSDFLPGIPTDGSTAWLRPGVVTDRSDPKLAHLDGLNLSRAWMLDGVASALADADPRRRSLLSAASEHAEAALPAITGAHYEGGHWLGTFAIYLLTAAGR